ncbi:helix-turn-helix domain-containing protein [Streptomyces polychromogenes]|nr:helix-turn-helix domain-containing protein [Streptomyces polychromogenes]
MSEGGFGAHLRGRRSAAGLTQEELAERSGLSVRAIRDLEKRCGCWPRRSVCQRRRARNSCAVLVRRSRRPDPGVWTPIPRSVPPRWQRPTVTIRVPRSSRRTNRLCP